jgi:hypothetical protein
MARSINFVVMDREESAQERGGRIYRGYEIFW